MLARIYPQYVSKIAVKGTQFWLVNPEISLSGVKNLASAIIPIIEVKPGTDSAKKNHFTLLKKAPLEDGVTFFLQTEVKGSVSKNTPILYREMEVGYVNDVQLGELADRVIITIKVDKDYAYLVRQNSLFWNVSGLDVSIGLSGANVKAGTVDSLLRGGIAFTTPEEQNLLPMAKAERSFYLYKKAEPAWLEWRTAIPKP